VRILVVGAGLAGATLAWRLHEAGAEVVVVGTTEAHGDATAASGGLVRAFETEPHAATLAAESLAELLSGDPDLRASAGYQQTGSLYVLPSGSVPPVAMPTAGRLMSGAEVERRFGLTGLPAGAIAVWEPDGGYIDVDRLRCHALGKVRHLIAEPAARLIDGGVVLSDGRIVCADAVVLAAGAWTPGLLRANGLPAPQRTKHIQYASYAVARPVPAFVDETTGLYGRPDGPGRMLLGLPSDRWDVPPGTPAVDARLEASVRRVAASRGIRAGRSPGTPVSAVDCYTEPPGLALRPVAGSVHTFTGGSGGAAKSALAASRRAASDLLDPVRVSPRRAVHDLDGGSA